MQALKPGRRADYQDVLNAPAHMVAEVIDCVLRTQPRPAMPHARARSSLCVKIGGPFDYDSGGPGGWWILKEPELHLAQDIIVPDLTGWRRERMPNIPDTAYATLAPDWACEVLSPGTAGWTCTRSDRSTPAKASPICGSSIRSPAVWRPSSSGTASGC